MAELQLQLRLRNTLESNGQNEEETQFAFEANVEVVKAVEAVESAQALMQMVQQLMVQNKEAQLETIKKVEEAQDRAERAQEEAMDRGEQAQAQAQKRQLKRFSKMSRSQMVGGTSTPEGHDQPLVNEWPR